ncbi:hypothetical protein ACFONL_13360 [Camelimonas fluminis]|uniref:Uncharacterized protein n=1 Tax=Camelimonas fluminis TaxID=1576911 RepID=A0ABV7UIW1_9HYPH|nr:hypothetical protein [Camelimonas fluminis]
MQVLDILFPARGVYPLKLIGDQFAEDAPKVLVALIRVGVKKRFQNRSGAFHCRSPQCGIAKKFRDYHGPRMPGRGYLDERDCRVGKGCLVESSRGLSSNAVVHFLGGSSVSANYDGVARIQFLSQAFPTGSVPGGIATRLSVCETFSPGGAKNAFSQTAQMVRRMDGTFLM